MDLDKYLENIQSTEASSMGGGFAIDSFPSVKPNYPENNDEEEDILITNEGKRVMIDLDGTIHKYSKGFADGNVYDEPYQKAKPVINWLKKHGYEIVIFTTRASELNAKEMGGDHKDQIQKVTDWLNKNNIYFDRITSDKLAADFYIDDRAIELRNGDWSNVINIIKNRLAKDTFN